LLLGPRCKVLDIDIPPRQSHEIVRAVRTTAAGQSAIDPAIAPRLIARLRRPPAGGDTLTERELDVLRRAARGLTNKQIGAELQISDRTVQNHLANIELRAMIGDLRPPALAELGLLPTVELLLDRSGEDGPEVTLVARGDERRLAPQSELALFRIVQEAWSNIRHHAQAGRADFTFTYEHDRLHVTITDDGVGFAPPVEANAPDGHWWLRGMRERAELTATRSVAWRSSRMRSAPSMVGSSTASACRPAVICSWPNQRSMCRRRNRFLLGLEMCVLQVPSILQAAMINCRKARA
jgi:DNA-binding CsgD family transcriptional regulator